MAFEILQAQRAERFLGIEQLVLVLDVLMLGLLIALFLNFFQSYRKLKTPFGLGLLIFAGALMLQTLLSIVFRLRPSPAGFVFFELAPQVFGIFALVVLLYLVTK